jgi:simple sugar transport system permease protein
MMRKGLRFHLDGGRTIWPVLGLVALLVLNLIFSERFFHLEILDGRLYGTLVDVLNQGSKVMLLAVGMTLVIATGGVDLSVGSVMAVSGAVGAVLVTRTEIPFPALVACALSAAVLMGLANGVLVALAGVQPIVATLIFMVLGRGVAMLITGGQIITFEDRAFVFLANGHFLGLPLTAAIVALVLAGTALLTRGAAVGLFIEATGNNETASRLCGVNTRMVKVLVYGFSGFCAGAAGLIAASNIKAADSSRVGEMMELDAIFAVVAGGTALTGGRFTLIGSIVGALLIQILTTTMYNLGVPPTIAPVPKAALIIVVCLLQSEQFRRHFVGRREIARPTVPETG